MSRRLQGIGVSPGRVLGRVRRPVVEVPRVPHRTISRDAVEGEVGRFREALEWALERTSQLRERTADRLGDIEAKIFEPQALMLEDPDLVNGTEAYIRENFLSAERAFDLRMLEIRSRFLDSSHVMVLDRLADLRDVRARVLTRLLDGDASPVSPADDSAVLCFDDLTPSTVVGLEPGTVRGILTAAGSRASHAAVLVRSMGIPAVMGMGEGLEELADGEQVILDGATGRVVADPSGDEVRAFQDSVRVSTIRRERIAQLARLPAETSDGVAVSLQVNLDQPGEVDEALRVGAEGVGLFRSEFLVIGRRSIPSEEEQIRAYRKVLDAFPEQEVTLRTFDIGGDKFPIFLQVPTEENPYLGWRAIRVCLDRPDLFRSQLRAALRARTGGNLRLLLPFVTSVEEIRRTREILQDVRSSLPGDGEDVPLGIMVETPAAVEILDLLAPLVDFVSLGTNDLTQYVLAVDRGNARLSDLYDGLHPALFRLYGRVRKTASAHDLDLGMCGSLATDPVGLAALIGLGFRKFSLPPSLFPEVKEWVRAVDAGELAEICGRISDQESADEIRAPLRLYMEAVLPGELTAPTRLSKSG